MLSPLASGMPSTNTRPRTLTQVSDIRGRVLGSNCHGENDDAFHFCQWCAAPSSYASKDSNTTALLYIDKYAIEQRFAQFTKAVWRINHPHADRMSPVYYSNICCSSECRAAQCTYMATVQPSGVVALLCWLESLSEKRRRVVYARDCELGDTSDLSNCSTAGHTLRYAHDSLRTNCVSKLAMAYKRDLGSPTTGKVRLERATRSEAI